MKSPSVYIVCLLFAQKICAQTKDEPFTIGLWGVKTEYIGGLGNNVLKFGTNFHGGVAVSFDYYLNRFFDVGAYGSFLGTAGIHSGINTYTNAEQWLNRSQYNNETQNFKASFGNFDIHTRFKILNGEKHRFVPYIGVGAGMAFFSKIQTEYIDKNGNRQIMHYSQSAENHRGTDNLNAKTLSGIVGLEYKVSPVFSIRYQATGSWVSSGGYDFHTGGNKALLLQHSVGLSFNISRKAKDFDGDGIPNYRDKCPNQWGLPRYGGCPPNPIAELEPKTLALRRLPRRLPNLRTRAVNDKISDYQDTVENRFVLHFEFDQTELGKSQISLPGTMVNLQSGYTIFSITLFGHTDDLGEKSHNQKVSVKRAEAVKQQLIKYGIDEDLITIIGYGSSEPIADNRTREGKAKNRRVEILIKTN